MKHSQFRITNYALLIFCLFLYNNTLLSQTEKPQTLILPTVTLGKITKARKIILEKTFESKLDDYFDVVPKELLEEAQEKAFQELDYEEWKKGKPHGKGKYTWKDGRKYIGDFKNGETEQKVDGMNIYRA